MPKRYFDLTTMLSEQLILDRLDMAKRLAAVNDNANSPYELYYEGIHDTLLWVLDHLKNEDDE